MTTSNRIRPACFRLVRLALVSLALFAARANEAGEHELLLFLSADIMENRHVSDDSAEGDSLLPSADIVYSYSQGRFRVLGEYLWSSTEADFERLQFGWEPNEDTMLWLGRVHLPSVYWNTEFHHGQYLQTSISRPGIDEFEDDGGVLPTHTAGMLAHTKFHADDTSGLQFGLSIGAGPRLRGDELKPFNVLAPGTNHGLSVSFSAAFFPDFFAHSQIGLLGGWSRIPVDARASDLLRNPELVGLDDVDQLTIGGYVDWQAGDWRFISTIVNVNNSLRREGDSKSDSFTTGYLQTQYEVNSSWTLYGRIEETAGENSSDYLGFLPEFVPERKLLGVRYDFVKPHALTLEAAQIDTVEDEFLQFRLQWSTVLP